MALIGAAPAQATFPGRNGSLALTQKRVSRSGKTAFQLRVHFFDAGATEIEECGFASYAACPSQPTYSADGAKIAWGVGSPSRGGRITVSDTGDGPNTTLPALTAADGDPAFAADGAIVFAGRPAHGPAGLFSVAADGTGLRQLTRDGGTRPACAADGHIAYVRGKRIRLIRGDGSGGRTIASGTSPDFAPSSKAVSYTGRGGAYVVRLTGSTRARKPRRLRKGASNPVYSPDGKKLDVISPAGFGKLYSIDLHSGRILRRVASPETGEEPGRFGLTDVVWSPRPSALALATRRR
jgi:Tol biopolymer transport system component